MNRPYMCPYMSEGERVKAKKEPPGASGHGTRYRWAALAVGGAGPLARGLARCTVDFPLLAIRKVRIDAGC